MGVSPVMLLVKVPSPDPSVVLVVKAIVGLAEVLQHTPLAVIEVSDPEEVTVPPLEAEFVIMEDTVVVVTAGRFWFS